MGAGRHGTTGGGILGTGLGAGAGAGHHDTYGTGHTGMGTGGGILGTGLGAGAGSHDTHGMGAGHTAGMGGAGTGHGYDAEGKETMGHKIKKMIPGGCWPVP
jgi:hypothetical protein